MSALRNLASAGTPLVSLLVLSSPLAAQSTWTVDDNGSADFVHIQDAIDNAMDGDVIEILAGAYAAFDIDGRALTLRAVGDAEVVSGVTIRNVPPGMQVEIDSLTIGRTFAGAYVPALTLENNAGTVRIVDTAIYGFSGVDSYYGGYYGCPYPWTKDCLYAAAGLSCSNNNDVVVLRCTVRGGGGADSYDDHGNTGGANALRVDGSFLSIHESTCSGGSGGRTSESGHSGAGGGNGVNLTSSTLFADATSFRGGRGGSGGGCHWLCQACCGVTGPNGRGMFVGPSSHASWKACSFGGADAAPSGPNSEVFVAPYCFGTFEECPCNNAGFGTAGCENAHVAKGVELVATGTPSVANDTVLFTATGLNPGASLPTIFFQGDQRENNGSGTVFNDGLLCASGTIVRLKGVFSMNGTATLGFGTPNDAPVSTLGGLPSAGGTRTYQLWYRSQPDMFCLPAPFNMSNGVEIVWGP